MKRSATILAICAALLLMIACTSKSGFSENTKAMKKASHSVVTIETYDKNGNLLSTGSGFIAFSSTTVATCFHVIDGAYSIVVFDENNTASKVKCIKKYHKGLDIALLEIDNTVNYTPLQLSKKESMKGEKVVAIGSPLGINIALSVGIISAYVNMDDVNYIQFTAPISHGSSGGALFDDSGAVIGITSASFGAGQNMNLAIPISIIKQLDNYQYQTDCMLDIADFYAMQHPAEKYEHYFLGVRLLTIKPGMFSSASTMDEAKSLAESIYYEWANGKADEDSFSDIAKELGLDEKKVGLQVVLPGELYSIIDSWCFDRSRKIGDAAVLQNINGYSIVYVVGADERSPDLDKDMPKSLQRQAAENGIKYEKMIQRFQKSAILEINIT